MEEVEKEEASNGLRPPTAVRFKTRLARMKGLALFAGGILAALFGLLLFRALNPPAEPLTIDEVNQAVAQAMASATPAPAFSAQVYRLVQPSLVLIETSGPGDRSGESGESGQPGNTPIESLGSGVIISDQGQILTALHVIEGASDIQVYFADGTQSSAVIASTLPESDIAVLQPDQLPSVVVPAVLGNPGAMQVGDEVFAVGNPFGLYSSMSAGVISGFERSFQAGRNAQRIEGLIQIDTAVNPGNSGGPLLNRSGQVIGIVIGILNPIEEEFFVGIGFAVPITIAGGAAGAPPY